MVWRILESNVRLVIVLYCAAGERAWMRADTWEQRAMTEPTVLIYHRQPPNVLCINKRAVMRHSTTKSTMLIARYHVDSGLIREEQQIARSLDTGCILPFNHHVRLSAMPHNILTFAPGLVWYSRSQLSLTGGRNPNKFPYFANAC